MKGIDMSIALNISLRTALLSACLGGLATVASAFFPATASADRLRQCADEGGICRLRHPGEVVYGARGRTTSRFFDQRAVPCSNRVFGDPAPGRPKSCYTVERGGYDDGDYGDGDYGDGDYGRPRGRWAVCANEGEFCEFYGRKVVRYGARGRLTEGVFRGGVRCDNRVFGDPAPGREKRCYIQQ